MATSPVTNVLFVPYRPRKTSPAPQADTEISQQKHAAREYHRKMKHRRLSGKKRSDGSVKNSSDEGPNIAMHRSPEVGPIISRSKSAPICSGTSLPLPLLLGSGRSDPFDVYSVQNLSPYVHEMLEYSLTYQWSIYSYCNPTHGIEDMKRYVMNRAMHSPAAFYAVIFAGATHNALKRYGSDVPPENTLLRLSYKTRFLELMSQEIEAHGALVSNEILYTMLSLAAFGSSEKLQPLLLKPPQSPLASGCELEFYGRLPCEWAHLRVLYHLIKQRGGLTAIARRGFAVAVACYDILTSFQRLAAPAFPLLETTGEIMSSWPRCAISRRSSTSRGLGVGFECFGSCQTLASLNPLIRHIVNITLGYSRYIRDESDAPTLHDLLKARNAVQHDLLCLPDGSSNFLTTDDCIYEVCRLATCAFTLLVLFPLPKPHGPHEQLAFRLKVAVENCTNLDLWTIYPGLMTWASLLGGMVSRDGPLRPWFLAQAQNSAIRNSIGAWPLVKRVVSNYLWLASECDGEGLAYWCEACEAVDRPSTTTTSERSGIVFKQ